MSRRSRRGTAHSATLVLATVDEAAGVDTTDTEFDVDNVVPLNGAFPESTIAGVQNTFRHEFDDDATVLLTWNDQTHAWETVQGACPEE